MTSVGTTKPVIVGIDGSDADKAVLAWAVDEAQRRSPELVIAHGRDVIPDTPAAETGVGHVLSEAADYCRGLMVEAALAAIVTEPDVTVRTVLRVAKPSELL